MTGPITSLTPAPLTTITAQPPLSAGFPSPPSFDPIERLPEERKDLLRKLRQHADDARALAVPFEDVRAASMYRIEKENELRRLTAHPQDGGFNLPETDRRVIVAQQALTRATEDLQRLQERAEKRAAAQQAALLMLAAAETWLREGVPGNCRIEVIETEPPKLNKNETIVDGIDRLRRRGRELKADLHRIASAPFPSSYAKQRMREQVETLAMQGAPSVSALIELDGKIEFQTQRLTSEVHGERRSLAFAEMPNTIALFAWLHRDALIAALDREIATESDDGAALSHSDRELRTAETMGDLLAVERDECALVWQAQAQNLPCEHRQDVSVLALLSIALVTTPRADASPETSPGLSWLRR
jgi:hypothetical protein